MYDPTTARWLSRDPIMFRGGDANLYRYVRNQPTIVTDPSGMAEWSGGNWNPLNSSFWGNPGKTEPSWWDLYFQNINPFSTPQPSVTWLDTGLKVGKGGAAVVAGAAVGGICYLGIAGGTAVGSITLTEYVGSTHFMVGIERVVEKEVVTTWYHALGAKGAIRLVGASDWEVPVQTFWNTVTIPLRNPANAIAVGESGAATTNCLTGAAKVIGAGLK